MRLLIVGFGQAGHMGSYLASAARQLRLDYQIMDANRAEASSRIGQIFYWRLRGKRPGRIRQFGAQVLDASINGWNVKAFLKRHRSSKNI